MHAQMKARMDAEGLPYGERSRTYNSRLAQELGKWADTRPGGEALHDALFRAYFVDARDISQPAVLLEIVEQIGLPVAEAREVLEKRTFKAAVDEDWALSRQIGVTGVPTFVAGRYGVVGAQPYETLEELVRRAALPPPASQLRRSRRGHRLLREAVPHRRAHPLGRRPRPARTQRRAAALRARRDPAAR